MNIDSESIAERVAVLDFLEAKEMQDAITANVFPNMKKQEQEKLVRSLSKRLNPRTEARPVTMADLARILGE